MYLHLCRIENKQEHERKIFSTCFSSNFISFSAFKMHNFSFIKLLSLFDIVFFFIFPVDVVEESEVVYQHFIVGELPTFFYVRKFNLESFYLLLFFTYFRSQFHFIHFFYKFLQSYQLLFFLVGKTQADYILQDLHLLYFNFSRLLKEGSQFSSSVSKIQTTFELVNYWRKYFT